MENTLMIDIKDKEFNSFAQYVRDNYGIHFKNEKKTLIAGRLGPLMKNLNINSLEDYIEYVIEDKSGSAASVMLDRITTNHTFFMREAEHFNFFSKSVLPLLEHRVRDKDLRIWSAACSSGEEAYTLAMLLDEHFSTNKSLWDTKVLATDISQKVLNVAKKGVYSKERIAPLPNSWKSKYFDYFDKDNVVVNDKIKKEVVFARLNLMDKTFPFRKKMHVIFCRNVMIYFDNQTKNELIDRLYHVTEPGGFLFVGHSESLNRESSKFKYLMPAVYVKE